MNEKETQQLLGAASDLNAKLDALRKENETLFKIVAISAKQREKYAAIEAENKALKNNWRMTFAGQAMQALIVSQPQFSDAKVIAYTAFMIAEAMLKEAEKISI